MSSGFFEGYTMRLVHCLSAASNCTYYLDLRVSNAFPKLTKGIMSVGWVVSLCASSSL